jgi:thiol-disulfide isomerase/thioredoxin
MNKQKIFSFLSVLGLLFLIGSVIHLIKNKPAPRPEVETVIEVPRNFSGQFSRVITKKRLEPMNKAEFTPYNAPPISWDHFEGTYLLVNFWATWCPPCVIELPSLDKLRAKFDGKGLDVIAISLDTQRDQSQIQKFLENRNLSNFAAYMDENGEVQKNIKMRGIPTTYLLNPNGEVLYVFEGDADWAGSSALKFFNMLLVQ